MSISYTSSRTSQNSSGARCPECHSNKLLYNKGSIICRDCGHSVYKAKRRNKYNASKQVALDGIRRDSKLEARVADELYFLKRSGAIKDYDSQYKVKLNIYDKDGNVAFAKNWKVDFRIHNNDGTYKLLEAKGIEGDDYKWKRDVLMNVWLKEHQDYTYEVRK